MISPEQAAGLDISSTQAADELFAMYGIRGCGLLHFLSTWWHLSVTACLLCILRSENGGFCQTCAAAADKSG